MNSFVSRIFAILMTIVALLSGGKVEKIQLKVSNSVTSSESKIEYVIENYASKKIGIDKAFILEKQVEGQWTNDWLEGDSPNFDWNEIAIEIMPFSSYTGVIDLGLQGYFLEAGTYRLTKSWSSFNNFGSISVSFDVKE